MERKMTFGLTFGLIMLFIGLIAGIIFSSPYPSSKALRVFADSYSGALTALATIVLTFITYLYVDLTGRLVAAQTRPKVLVTLQREFRYGQGKYVKLEIQNVGFGPAYFIKFEINPPSSEYLEGRSISSIGPFQEGLEFLAPNQKKRYNLGPLNLIEQNLRGTSIKIMAKYKDSNEINHKDLSIVSLALMESEYSLVEIVGGLGLIKVEIQELSLGIGNISRTLSTP
jgi:hypothetical protein